MSRPIKFRAWYNYPCSDLKPKKPHGTGSDWFPRWQMGPVQTYYQSKNKVRISGFQRYYSVDDSYKESKDSCDMQIGKDCIVMQYTGLKDKNGKDIYEGDILLIPDEVIAEYIGGAARYEPENRIEAVVWDEQHAMWITNHEALCEQYHDSEVIGNIYEHGHLLEANQ